AVRGTRVPNHNRGLPPARSGVGSAGHCPRRQQRVARALYPRAPALRLSACPPSGLCVVSRLTSHCSLLASALYPRAAALRLMVAEAHGCDSAPWCPALPTPERAGGSPRLRFGTLVPGTARGVSSAVPGLFTRGLPPCGSARVRPAAYASSYFSLLTSHFSSLARALYPRAPALRLMCVRPAAQRVLIRRASRCPMAVNTQPAHGHA
ncbi:MAG: hypothetical protein RLZZ436_4564, partial [Planctomycetota bacterium]